MVCKRERERKVERSTIIICLSTANNLALLIGPWELKYNEASDLHEKSLLKLNLRIALSIKNFTGREITEEADERL